MISEIIKFENIGTPNYFVELLDLIHKNTYGQKEIGDFFINKWIDGNTIFDGGLLVLKYLDFIEISNDDIVSIPIKNQHFLRNEKLLKGKIVSIFLDKWQYDESFKHIFNEQNLLHDINQSIVVRKSSFMPKYPKLKQFLIDFSVLEDSCIDDCFQIKSQYKKYFDKKVVKQVQLSLKELRKIQNLKNRYGDEAEVFVLNFERQKFKKHSLIDAIEQISIINSAAGYDVVSIMDNNSSVIDKFIEVKSYSQNPSFFWSKNEIEVAKQEQDNYFLYLVNRDEMCDDGYQPLMIQNPYKNVSNKYRKECKSWKFIQITK
jgi:hypothetical protein